MTVVSPFDPRAAAATRGWTIPRMFARTVAKHAERPAVITDDECWSYRDLDHQVAKAANALYKLGIRAGDRIALWLPNSVDWIVTSLAIASVRAIIVPINIRLRPQEVEAVLTQAEVSTVITTEAFLTNRLLDLLESLIGPTTDYTTELHTPRFPHLRRVLTTAGHRNWSTNWPQLLSEADSERLPAVQAAIEAAHAAEPVTVFWTSGSTGLPKGSISSHAILGNVASFCSIMKIDEHDRCLISSPLFYVAGFYWCLLAPVHAGACMVPMSLFTAAETLDAIERHRATVLIGIAHWHRRLLEEPDLDQRRLDSLRAMYAGGGALPPKAIQTFLDLFRLSVFCTVYGLTEAGGIVSMSPAGDAVQQISDSIGYLLPSFELRCVDPTTGADVPAGQVGEAWLRGPYLHLGYVGQEQDGETWLRTGDLVSEDRDGRLHFRGRCKDIVKVGGENVTTDEIETVLRQHPAVVDCAVIGLPDARRGEVVGAAIVAPSATPEAIRTYCRARLAPFKVPQAIVMLPALPLTPGGKPDRGAIRGALQAQTAPD